MYYRTWGYWSPALKSNFGSTPTLGLMAFLLWNAVTHYTSRLSNSPRTLFNGLHYTVHLAYYILLNVFFYSRIFSMAELTLMARRHHFGGGGGGRSSGGFRNVLFLLILIAIVPLIILVLTGPNTGNSGIYGNVTVSNTMRNSAVTFASFFVVFVILIVVKGLEFLGI